MDKPEEPTSSLISEAHRAKAARIAERLIDRLHASPLLDDDDLDSEALGSDIAYYIATAIHKLDLVSRGPASR